MSFPKIRTYVNPENPFSGNGSVCARFTAPPQRVPVIRQEAVLSAEPFIVDGVWIPRAIVGIRSRYAVPLYLELRRHCYESPSCFPGVRRLARLCGCSIGTVSALTDEFHRLGIVTKLHDGRHCVYRFAQGCWRRRKPSKAAHRSVSRTEDRIPFGDSTDKRKNQKTDVSYEHRAKRVNLIKTLRRWATLSPYLPDAERGHRLAVLDRCEASLDNWHGRPVEDRKCFEMMVARAKAMPLEPACVQSLAQRPVEMMPIGAILPVLGGKIEEISTELGFRRLEPFGLPYYS